MRLGEVEQPESLRSESIHRERVWLALLCQNPADAPLRAELELLLALHSWVSADHRVVFAALAGRRSSPEAIRAELPAQLTRLGFPDVDIEDYFSPAGASVETAIGWLRQEQAGSAIPSNSSNKSGDSK